MNTYSVYCHTHKETGKRYVGMTHDIPRRWRSNGVEYRSKQCAFGDAISEYGWDAFEHEVLESGLTEEEACEREKYYINLYDTRTPEHGYNVAEGGLDENIGMFYIEHPKGMAGKHHGDAKREQQRELMKRLNAEGKCGAVWKNGHPRGMLGKHHSEEFKERLRAIPSDKHPSARPVTVEYPDGRVEQYGCLKYLSQATGVSESTLIKTIKSGEPYKISKNTYSNLDNLRKIEGALIYYQTIPR